MYATFKLTVRKRKVERTLNWPDFANMWRGRNDPPAHMFRFHTDRTTYTRGQLRIDFDLDGNAFEGWSYWTCIFCYAEATPDYPQGRLIFNASGYGSTTGKHIGDMRPFFAERNGTYTGKVARRTYSRVQKVVRKVEHPAYTQHDGTVREAWSHDVWRSTQAYTSQVELCDVEDTTIDQWLWGRGVTPDQMRAEARTMARHTAYGAESRASRIQWATYAAERHAAEAAERAAAHAQGLIDGSVVALGAKRGAV